MALTVVLYEKSRPLSTRFLYKKFFSVLLLSTPRILSLSVLLLWILFPYEYLFASFDISPIYTYVSLFFLCIAHTSTSWYN